MRRFVETAVCVAVALTLVGTWLVEPCAVVSGSMHPTLMGPHRDFVCEHCGREVKFAADITPMPDRAAYCPYCKRPGPVEDRLPIVPGDAVLVDRTTFYLRAPRRWEVIAFRLPGKESRVAVKRVAGLPGETIAIRDGDVWIDGRREPNPLGLRYEPPRLARPPESWTLGTHEYFVLGDNSLLSDDSRTWSVGPGVASQLIVGKPFIVHAPRCLVDLWGVRFHVPDLSAIRYIR
jgi:signal peptidase I